VKQIHHWAAAERGMFNSTDIIPAAVPYVAPNDDDEDDVDSEYETLTWKPGVADSELVMYLRAARSMAAFAGMCDGGPTDACTTGKLKFGQKKYSQNCLKTNNENFRIIFQIIRNRILIKI